MQGLTSLLRIGKPSNAPRAVDAQSATQPPLVFSPLPGRLPSLTFHPVSTFITQIGNESIAVYHNASTGTCWGFRRQIARSQNGAVFVCAQLVLNAQDGNYYYRLPYQLVAVKMESKAKVQDSQARLARGGHGDNSMLDRALVRFLESTPAGPHAIKLLECWHDKDNLYSVMEYLRDGDLLDCVAANPESRCLSENFARKAVAGALRCLTVLHSAGFMHRDISPENVMVDGHGNGVLIDFGSALPMVPQTGDQTVDMAALGQLSVNPPPVAGWQPLRPPAYGPSFCKPQYACPWYVWSRPWYGIAYDLFSIGTTLFAVLEGRTLYSGPAPGSDPAFTALLETDPAAVAAWSTPGAVPVGAADGPGGLPAAPSRLLNLLQQWNAGRVASGRAPLSAEVIDLLARLLQITPACRPLTAAEVLSHPWFAIELPEDPPRPQAPAQPAQPATVGYGQPVQHDQAHGQQHVKQQGFGDESGESLESEAAGAGAVPGTRGAAPTGAGHAQAGPGPGSGIRGVAADSMDTS